MGEVGSLDEAENMMKKIKKFQKQVKNSTNKSKKGIKKVEDMEGEMVEPGDIKKGDYIITSTARIRIYGVEWKKSKEFGKATEFSVVRDELIPPPVQSVK